MQQRTFRENPSTQLRGGLGQVDEVDVQQRGCLLPHGVDEVRPDGRRRTVVEREIDVRIIPRVAPSAGAEKKHATEIERPIGLIDNGPQRAEFTHSFILPS